MKSLAAVLILSAAVFAAVYFEPLTGDRAAHNAAPLPVCETKNPVPFAERTSDVSAPAPELALMGTALSEKGGYAVIADRDGNQEIFAKGQSVFGEGVLKEVKKETAVINTASGEMELRLRPNSPDSADSDKSGGQSAGGEADKNGDRASAGPEFIPATEAFSVLPGETPPQAKYIIIDTPYISNTGMYSFSVKRDWLTEVSGNTKRLLAEAEISPNLINGSQRGYEVKGVEGGGVYEHLGLLPGDVILTFNEKEIHGLREAREIVESLRRENNFKMGLVRGGEEITLSYDIK